MDRTVRGIVSRIVEDLRRGEYVEHYLLIVLATLIAILNVFGVAGQRIVSSTVLAVLALVIYGQVASRRALDELRSSRAVLGITRFHADRGEIPSLDERLENSAHEIAIHGLQLGTIAHTYLPLLERQARKGRRVKLLLMSPVDRSGSSPPWITEVAYVHTFSNLERLLRTNAERLSEWVDSLSDDVKERIEVRFFPSIPTVSMLLVDRDSRDGWIQLEPLIYRVPPPDRPSFVVTRTSSSEVYDRLGNSFDALWQRSIFLAELPLGPGGEEGNTRQESGHI